jgi:hypothetical protein
MASECGPWGLQQTQILDRAARLNAAYSTFAWENAKQDGCLPCPGAPGTRCGGMPPSNAYPTWPPPANKGFIYPVLSKQDESVIGAAGANPDICGPGVAPWSDAAPEGLQPTRAMQRAEYALGCQPQAEGVISADQANQNVELSELVAKSILDGDIPRYSYGDGHPRPVRTGVADKLQTLYEQTFGKGKSEHKKDEAARSVESAETMSLNTLLPCMGNTLTGIVYDMQHMKELPPDVNKFNYIFVRDDRWKYGLLFCLFFLLLILLIVAAAMSATSARQPSWTPRRIVDLERLAGSKDYEIIIRKS